MLFIYSNVEPYTDLGWRSWGDMDMASMDSHSIHSLQIQIVDLM